MRRRRAHTGQATIEGLLALGLVIIPAAIAAGYAFRSDWDKTRCAYLSFRQARQTLIATGEKVRFQQQCGSAHEELVLLPLESLDLDRGGLDLKDFQEQASQYWERFSSLRALVSELPSSASEVESAATSIDKLTSTDKAGPPRSSSEPPSSHSETPTAEWTSIDQ